MVIYELGQPRYYDSDVFRYLAPIKTIEGQITKKGVQNFQSPNSMVQQPFILQLTREIYEENQKLINSILVMFAMNVTRLHNLKISQTLHSMRLQQSMRIRLKVARRRYKMPLKNYNIKNANLRYVQTVGESSSKIY